MIRVLGIGDNVCDKYLPAGVIYPGGNALNIAVFSRFLGCESAYLGVIGDDETGQHVYDVLREIGLDLSHCRFEAGENGIARVELRDGDRVFLQGNQPRRIARQKPPVLGELDIRYMAGFDLLHTSVYSYMESELPKLRAAGPFVSMDFSDCIDEDYFARCCPHIDCAILSCADMPREEIEAVIGRIFAHGCRQMVLATRGAKGALVSIGGRLYEQSPCLVKAKDTMGAGDSFITAFLVNYLHGAPQAQDFPKNSGSAGMTTRQAYLDALIRISLYRAAVFSAAQCQRDGSFGYGKKIGVNNEDRYVMEHHLTM